VSNSCRVLDPATGRVRVLPESPAPEHADRENVRKPYTSFALGWIGATGEYKVLRMFSRPILTGFHQCHLFEVFTISCTSGSCSSHAQWRVRPSHEEFFEPGSAIVVSEVVYFKVDTVCDAMICGGVNPGIPLDLIYSFDLEREEWRGILQGPIYDIFQTDEYDDDLDDYRSLWSEITLADLSGSLALVHYRKYQHVMDLWLLKDFDNGIWVKEYMIQIEPIFPTTEWCVKALFMLDDGRIVIHFPKSGLLFIYDPRTDTSAQVEMRHLDALAMYTGNLLSLQVGDMV
jgi:F-box interacting protein